MDEEVIQQLLSLNRDFYANFAEHFAASRSVSDPALTAILPHLPSDARILDVGCGNGRLAVLLDQERPGSCYVGVDAVPELIEEARAQAADLSQVDVAFRVGDISKAGWTERLAASPTSDFLEAGFDCAVALAVLHHLPSFGLRARVLRDIAGVLRPKGFAIVSTWRFLAHERMRRKIVDWDAVGIDECALEPGDFLLDWRRGGRGLRYCHMIDEDEMRDLACVSGLTVRESFRAGGREGDLSLFGILDPAG